MYIRTTLRYYFSLFSMAINKNNNNYNNQKITSFRENVDNFFLFLRPHLWHMEVPRPEIKWELLLPAYTTATAMLDPSPICNLRHSLSQHWILNPLSEARDWTCILMDTRHMHPHVTMDFSTVKLNYLNHRTSNITETGEIHFSIHSQRILQASLRFPLSYQQMIYVVLCQVLDWCSPSSLTATKNEAKE